MKIKFTILSLILLLMTGFAFAQFAYITNKTDNTVTAINVANNTVIATIPVGHYPLGVTVSLDGKWAYITNYWSNSVSVINTATNTVTATIPVKSYPEGICVTPDGSKVYVANQYSDTISVINTATNTVIDSILVGNSPLGVAASPDGSKVYVANTNSNSIYVINTATDAVSGIILGITAPYGLCVSPDGTKLYVTNGDTALKVVNTATNTVSATISGGLWACTSISISRDGTKVYVVNSGNDKIGVINTVTNTVSAIFPGGIGPTGISLTPDGQELFVVDRIVYAVTIYNTATNTLTGTIHVGNWPNSFGNFITPCSAKFTIFPDSVIAYQYWITNHAAGAPPLQYLWSWGDGNFDSTAYPNHIYIDSGDYTISLTITDSNGCQSTFINYYYQIWVPSNQMVYVNVINNIMTSVKPPKTGNTISIYPNPASTAITIENLRFINYDLRITDVLGNEIYHQPITPDSSPITHIDISRLCNGVYFYQIIYTIESGKETQRGKIVVEK
jgi:YVTN family beta-propeller protein